MALTGAGCLRSVTYLLVSRRSFWVYHPPVDVPSQVASLSPACPVSPGQVAARSPVVSCAVHPGIVNTNLIRYITPPGVMQAREADLQASLRMGKLLGGMPRLPDHPALHAIGP